jgi:hypothetical protein
MEAILKFDLNDPDDKREHERMLKSMDMHLALWDISQELRSKVKYAPDSMSEDEYKAWEQAQEMFYRIINEYTINLDL